ncbi:hypothetical protein JMJ77_0005561, partial [Colletotrichum scovillei]
MDGLLTGLKSPLRLPIVVDERETTTGPRRWGSDS